MMHLTEFPPSTEQSPPKSFSTSRLRKKHGNCLLTRRSNSSKIRVDDGAEDQSLVVNRPRCVDSWDHRVTHSKVGTIHNENWPPINGFSMVTFNHEAIVKHANTGCFCVEGTPQNPWGFPTTLTISSFNFEDRQINLLYSNLNSMCINPNKKYD